MYSKLEKKLLIDLERERETRFGREILTSMMEQAKSIFVAICQPITYNFHIKGMGF